MRPRLSDGRPGWHGHIACLALFVITFGYFALFVHYGLNRDDEGVLLAQYFRAYLGDVLVRDFHIGYTPVGYWFHASLFHVLGPTILSLRWELATCHALVATCLFVIGRRIMPLAFACLAPLAYCAIMPFYPGKFASFNIPYPSWHVVLFMVVGLWMLIRFIESPSLWWIAASGFVTGICFSFKPNVGLFQLAMTGLVLLVVLEPPSSGTRSRWDVLAWWALLVGVAGGLILVFASQASARDMRIFLLPIAVVLGAIVARRFAVGAIDAPSRSLLAAVLVLMGATLVPVVPWTIYFLDVLGPQWFARALFFIGSGFEHIYYRQFHPAGPWDTRLVLGAVGLVGGGLLARAGALPLRPTLVVGGLAAVVAAVGFGRAPMPEGLHAAIVSRTEDLSFTASLIVHWAAIGMTLPALWAPSRRQQALVEIAVLLGALTMYLQLYPRSDFMHLVVAVPLTLVMAGRLAARFTDWFPTEAGLRSILRTAIVGGALCFVAFRVAPNLASVLTWENGPALRPHATLDLERAPLTLELGRESYFRALYDTVTYVQANSDSRERIFTFPSIEVLCFLADRRNASRHGYFFSRWPGHDVEAEVVSELAADPPRLMVVLHAHPFFFSTAPVYYFALREFVRNNYREVARFHQYVVLAHRQVPEASLTSTSSTEPLGRALDAHYGDRLRGSAPDRLEAARALATERLDFPWAPATGLLDDPDAEIRAAGVAALVSVRDPAVAIPLSRALLAERIPEHTRLRVLSHVSALGDARAVAPLVERLGETSDWDEYSAILSALNAISWRVALTDYWFGDADEITVGDFSGSADWRIRLANPDESANLRSFLARILPRVATDGLAPALHTALGSPRTALRIPALAGLLRLPPDERGGNPFATAIQLLAHDRVFAPSFVLQLYREDPPTRGPALVEALHNVGALGMDSMREDLAWVASATGDQVFRETFVALLAESNTQLRLAALVGLGRIADPATRTAIAGATGDSDYEVRRFATRALRALSAAPSSGDRQ